MGCEHTLRTYTLNFILAWCAEEKTWIGWLLEIIRTNVMVFQRNRYLPLKNNSINIDKQLKAKNNSHSLLLSANDCHSPTPTTTANTTQQKKLGETRWSPKTTPKQKLLVYIHKAQKSFRTPPSPQKLPDRAQKDSK